MSETEVLLREIEAFVQAKGVAETTFGRMSVNDGKLVRRLRGGGSVNLEKAAEIRSFIKSHADYVHRPRPRQKREEAA